MRRLVAVALRGLGLLDFDMIAKRSSCHPAGGDIGKGDLVHVVDGGVEKWACFRCPGGCGAVIPLSLNQKRRPAWSVATDWFGRPTIEPSVHQRNACGCHFWVRKGSIAWCEGGKPRPRDHRRDVTFPQNLRLRCAQGAAGQAHETGAVQPLEDRSLPFR